MTNERLVTGACRDATWTKGAPLLWTLAALMVTGWVAAGDAAPASGGSLPVFTEDQVLGGEISGVRFGLGLGASGGFLEGGGSNGPEAFYDRFEWDAGAGHWFTTGGMEGGGAGWLAPVAIDSTYSATYVDFGAWGDPWAKILIYGFPGASGVPGAVVWLEPPAQPPLTALATDGHRLVAGDRYRDWVGFYEYDSAAEAWELSEVVEDPDPLGGSGFGSALALDGDLLVVGSCHPLVGFTGRTYVFTADPDDVLCPGYWCLSDSLVVGQVDNSFGWAVTLSGDWIAVGAPYQDSSLPPFQDRGTVFLYQRDATGHFVLRDTVSGAGPTFHFGYSVALSGSTLLVGAPGEDFDIPPFNFEDIGAAYLFSRSGDQLVATAKLQSNSLQHGMRLGETVALSTSSALAGAPNMDVNGPDSGAVLSWVGFGIGIFLDGFESGDTSAWSSAVP